MDQKRKRKGDAMHNLESPHDPLADQRLTIAEAAKRNNELSSPAAKQVRRRVNAAYPAQVPQVKE